jgi:hypothetical protein
MKKLALCALALLAIALLYHAAETQTIRPARSFGIFGSVDHDGAASTYPPVLEGCYASAGAPSDVSADTDSVRAWCLRNGARVAAEVAITSGGTTPFRRVSTADTNIANVKAAAGQLYGVQASNVNAAVRYLHVYNASGSPTCNTSIIHTFVIPGNTAGGGTNIALQPGLAFSTGIGICVTTAVDGTGSVAANELVINLQYK